MSVQHSKLIVNASPIIALANVGYADLLLKLTEELIVPLGVFEEISDHKHSDCASAWIKKLDSSLIQKVRVSQIISEWNLGKGESQVLSYSCYGI